MKIADVKNLADLERYAREFKNWHDEAHLYDFGAVVSLWLSLMDNMRQLAVEDELSEIGYRMTDEQRRFLARLAQHASAITDEEIDKE